MYVHVNVRVYPTLGIPTALLLTFHIFFPFQLALATNIECYEQNVRGRVNKKKNTHTLRACRPVVFYVNLRTHTHTSERAIASGPHVVLRYRITLRTWSRPVYRGTHRGMSGAYVHGTADAYATASRFCYSLLFTSYRTCVVIP